MSLAKVVFEICGIFAFAMAFYFVGKLQGIREGQGMLFNILVDSVGEALGATEEQEEGEDNTD